MAKKTKQPTKTAKSTKTKKTPIVCENRKARFDYQIDEKFEAGLMLTGSEVKSLRYGKANLTDAYAEVRDNEAFLLQAHIEPYEMGGYANHEPKRKRKLLLHRKEIEKLHAKTKVKGFSLIPLKIYFKNGYAKVQLGLGHGKKTHDKRQVIKEREVGRELDRAMKNR